MKLNSFYKKVSTLVFHARNVTRITPIHLAGFYGSNPDVFRFLQENTNEKNPVDDFNHRPLRLAAMKGRVEICQIIFSSIGFNDKSEKIDIHNSRSRYKIPKILNDHFRDTPITLAQKEGHLEIVPLLEENLKQ